MQALDIRTLLFADALVGITLACVLWVSRRGPDGAVLPAARLWALAELLSALARSLYVVRGALPEAVAIVLPNGLLMTGYLVRYLALARLHAHPVRGTVLMLAGAAVWGAFALAALLGAGFGVRAGLFTALGLVVILPSIRLLLPHLRQSAGARVVAGAFAATTVLGVLRLSAGALQGAEHIFAAFAGQYLLVIGSIMLNVAAAAGFLACLHEGMRRELERQSVTDLLTGAANRRGLLEALNRELDRGRRQGLPVSVVMFDLDHFKRVNDELGHPAGDRTLQAFVACVREDLRAGDLLGRYGGEEFVLVLPATQLAQARCVAERVRQRVVEAPLAQNLTVTVSAGVASSDESGGDATVEALLSAADRRLYLAKERRNQVFAADGPGTSNALAGVPAG